MITLIKRTVAVAALIAAAAAPSTASAQLIGAAPDAGPVSSAVPSQATPQHQAGTSEGFQWDDAGIGAAGVLVLLGAGAGAASLAARRGTHEPRTS